VDGFESSAPNSPSPLANTFPLYSPPLPPDDEPSNGEVAFVDTNRYTAPAPSGAAPDGPLVLSSPEIRRRTQSRPPALIATADATTQTTGFNPLAYPPSPTPTHPSVVSYSSELSMSHPASDGGRPDTVAEGRMDKTAALGTLMQHVAALLSRLKEADITSLENRLRKQHLPGDVGHLAKTTARDIVRPFTPSFGVYLCFLRRSIRTRTSTDCGTISVGFSNRSVHLRPG
jgi:hypothetical protein